MCTWRFPDAQPIEYRRQAQEGTRYRRDDVQGAYRGYNLLLFLSAKEPCPRDGFIYWRDDGDLMALRVQQYKIVFAEQLATGLQVWREPLKQMRIPKMFDLRSDPFEAGGDSIRYNDWFVEPVPFQYAAQAVVHQWLESFKEFPPRQKAASFTVDQIVEKLMPRG